MYREKKVDILDAHDRMGSFVRQSFEIDECCHDLIKKRPFGEHKFYIFAHARTEDNSLDKRLIWQPRLTRPFAQTNSMLFKADPKTDLIEIIWIIPPPELWSLFEKGKITENPMIWDFITQFKTNKHKLEAPSNDDLSDEAIDQIYREISLQAKINRASQLSVTREANHLGDRSGT